MAGITTGSSHARKDLKTKFIEGMATIYIYIQQEGRYSEMYIYELTKFLNYKLHD